MSPRLAITLAFLAARAALAEPPCDGPVVGTELIGRPQVLAILEPTALLEAAAAATGTPATLEAMTSPKIFVSATATTGAPKGPVIQLVKLSATGATASSYYLATVAGLPGAVNVRAGGGQISTSGFAGSLDVGQHVNLSGMVIIDPDNLLVRHRQDFAGARIPIRGHQELRIGGGSAFRLQMTLEVPKPDAPPSRMRVTSSTASVEPLSAGIEYRVLPKHPNDTMIRVWSYVGPEIVITNGGATGSGTVSSGFALDF